jgi:hypothetical protein
MALTPLHARSYAFYMPIAMVCLVGAAAEAAAAVAPAAAAAAGSDTELE